ncbi:predicted protein [Botrytis cinerea T4]|uniref:Uncharacterized protein n=1 Tax=Botryotinia fuckeliana (strain T4) TaxID=999810 RepID=G2YR99_BOTF4|nr:predicted protein [Botrytis cinerea T4]
MGEFPVFKGESQVYKSIWLLSSGMVGGEEEFSNRFVTCALMFVLIPSSHHARTNQPKQKNVSVARLTIYHFLKMEKRAKKLFSRKGIKVGTPATMAGPLRPLSGSIVVERLKRPLDHPPLWFLDVQIGEIKIYIDELGCAG